MSGTEEYRCNFHGIEIRVSGSQPIIAAFEARLGQLPAPGAPGPVLQFDCVTAPTVSAHCVRKPEGRNRAFYEPQSGQALYFPEDDLLYLDYQYRVKALCRPGAGQCTISLLEPEIEQLWLGSHPFFTLPFIEMLKRREKFNLHAAAFACGESCLLFPGTTGAGKSTLSLCLLRAGLDFLGDDMVFLEGGGELRVLAFPERIDITDTTVSLFPELAAMRGRPKRPGWPKHDLCSFDYFPSKIAWSARPQAIIFPQISDVGESKLVQIEIDEAFTELAPNVLLTEPASTKTQLELLAQLVNSTRLYRLYAGTDFDRIAHLVMETLK